MSCHDAHHDHHHDHDHLPPPDTNEAQTLYSKINLDQVVVLNECDPGSGAAIIRKYSERLATEPYLESDVDPELLITIPFTGLVRLHSLLIRSFADARAPREIRIFKNRDDLDFTNVADLKEVQKLEHPAETGVGTSQDDGIVEYALNRAQLSNVTSITLHIPSNYGAETSAMTYIGLRGDFKELNRAPVVTMYEAAANPADHRNILKDAEQLHRTAD
ncbi:PITH domain-containing protein 1 [Wickerhamiella sorbophila]|uniref:PITH domain-containing protein 1 n=1 Tax=Wickerhamiella sorbophila TaxID=45607 RepID=A0A2T0FF43_9ASCO|nr:PITH domain-containing protein 1 [Wickerhamiella sorbophila]PRT53590.1 PITH domain-containing protein 1 [Wickerhamiella sorbophila]